MSIQLDAKRYQVLQGVPAPLLATLSALATPKAYKAGEVIYTENTAATKFYFLVRGKALFVNEPRPGMTVALGAIKPGLCFGWSAVLASETYTHTVTCAEDTEVLVLEAAALREALLASGSEAFPFLINLLARAVDRLQLRTGQVLCLMRENPDLQTLCGGREED
ncbi:putative transcriptional regulator, Crp/Fnr family [Desulfovibrio sp. X2]|uniref:cyclic nucleotide-binding domain-containing protein n=1 Tax=Desulfovibrio sp. X2 TaxID=941449 RepID=UPI000358E1A3|nr:cyclic nucleotide-binding domain-containing protein [Desulfovibrio sp. X2]EPR36332.1 putative transcriptional regulator, Crp/Fnr family [Desulfovibrio sp. X2]